MARTRRGGKRVGRPGVAHGQRTDLNVPSPEYGQGVARQEALRVGPPEPLVTPTLPAQATPPPAAAPEPGSFGDFLRPTERPDEPFTAGLSTGPGAGPESLAVPGSLDVGAELRLIYRRFPNEGLRRLIERA